MNDRLYEQFRESNWRRKLTPSEEAKLRAWLAGHPQMESDWETEAALSEALSRLPDAAVSTNFTARVLSRVEAMERTAAGASPRKFTWAWIRRVLLPRSAVAVVVLALGVFAFDRHRASQRAELAQSLLKVSRVADPELVQNFETIRRLDQTPSPDEQLLALLK